jgi:pyruvate/2-oxoacid:ferredoxin oxidoreductase beta subunit/Pyruvate/2-oxoacid:ferredoxin oxidoreductase gamma subunit
MGSLLNRDRPPVFCPGCSHEQVTYALDTAFQKMGLRGNQIVIVSDIGCSGLFDTFFHTHAFHGLHGRALTYGTGLKLARPDLNVVVTMGDGGQGIGGAHLLAACRRNIDLTLLVLNNFNFGMTGGQYSATTPAEARTGSGFLNQLERPIDVCHLAQSAGAPYVVRCSAYSGNLSEEIERAIRFKGFAVVDIWGICPGRYAKRNRLTPSIIKANMAGRSPANGIYPENVREEYGRHYREMAIRENPMRPSLKIEARFLPVKSERQEVVILGSAGQRIMTAGEILCLAGMSAGLNATQKNEYNITVLRGPAISDVILSPKEIGFTGIERPDVILALSQEGVNRRRSLFNSIGSNTLIVLEHSVNVPSTNAELCKVNLEAQGIKRKDWALASLSVVAKLKQLVSLEMLQAALEVRFDKPALEAALDLVHRVGLADLPADPRSLTQ